jgi:hypothetical protein
MAGVKTSTLSILLPGRIFCKALLIVSASGNSGIIKSSSFQYNIGMSGNQVENRDF